MLVTIDEPFNLAATLESGQAFRWHKAGDVYQGVVFGNVIEKIMIEKDFELAVNWLKETLQMIRNKEFSSRYFVITKALRGYYKNPQQIGIEKINLLSRYDDKKTILIKRLLQNHLPLPYRKKIVDKKPNELKKLFKNKNLDNIFRKITLNK